MVDADAHPSDVLRDVVHPVGIDAAQLVDEVVDENGLRIPFGPQLLATILERPHEFLLLRVHRDDRFSRSQVRDRGGVDVLELVVAVGVTAALQDLAIRLQAVPHVVEQSTNQAGTDLVSHIGQLGSQLAGALAGPAKRRFGVAATARLHQAFEIGAEGRVLVDRSFPPRTVLSTRPSAMGKGCRSSLIPRVIVVRAMPVATRHCGDASRSQRDRLRRHHEAALALIQVWRQCHVALLHSRQRGCIDHGCPWYTCSPPLWCRILSASP